jgi:hypothetical protein
MRYFPYVVLLCLGCSLDSSPIDSPGKRVFRAATTADGVEHLADASPGAAGTSGTLGSAGRAGSSSSAAGRAAATGGHSATAGSSAAGTTGAAGRAPAPDSGTDAALAPPDAGSGAAGSSSDATVDEDAGMPPGRTCEPCTATADCARGFACTMPARADVDGPATRCYLVADICPSDGIQTSLTTVESTHVVGCIPKYTCTYYLMHPSDAGL